MSGPTEEVACPCHVAHGVKSVNKSNKKRQTQKKGGNHLHWPECSLSFFLGHISVLAFGWSITRLCTTKRKVLEREDGHTIPSSPSPPPIAKCKGSTKENIGDKRKTQIAKKKRTNCLT